MAKNPDKYCTLYIVRHGETDWNSLGLVQGQTDTDLNSIGEEQARALGEELNGVEFALVYSSDLLRAKRTAEIILLEKKLAVQTTKLLRERSFGRYEGRNRESLVEIDQLLGDLTHQERFSTKLLPDVENDEDIVARFFNFAREVCVAHPGQNVLIITHGGVMRALLIHLGFITYQHADARRIKIGNTSYMKLKSDGVDFFIEELKGIQRLD